jgi:hypothetical protein
MPDLSTLAMPFFASLALVVVPGPARYVAGTGFIGLGLPTALSGGKSG